MLPRVAAVCGLVAPLTSTIGWAVGGLAQPGAYSSADDDISDLGALTASSAWIYNQIGANLTGLLVVCFALGLWRALSPDALGRVGAALLIVVGLVTGYEVLDDSCTVELDGAPVQVPIDDCRELAER